MDEFEDLTDDEVAQPESRMGFHPLATPARPTDKEDPRNRLKEYIGAQMKRQQAMQSPQYQELLGQKNERMAKANDNAAFGGLLMNSAALAGSIGGKVADSSAAQNYAAQLAANNNQYQNARIQDEKSTDESMDKKMKLMQYLAQAKDKEVAAANKPAQYGAMVTDPVTGDILALNKKTGKMEPVGKSHVKPDKDKTDKLSFDLAGEWDKHPETKNTRTVQTAYNKILNASNDPTGDMSIVYGIMKMQDPNSTVRESEYAQAENARGVPESIRNLWNKLRDGQKLTPEQRKQFQATAKDLYAAQLDTQKQVDERYSGLAKQRGINPQLLMMTDWQRGMPIAKNPPVIEGGDGTAIAAPTYSVGDIKLGRGGKKYKYKGGPVNDKNSWEETQ